MEETPKDTIQLKAAHMQITASQSVKLCGQHGFADTDL